jgi:opacity protein-like surface antigen
MQNFFPLMLFAFVLTGGALAASADYDHSSYMIFKGGFYSPNNQTNLGGAGSLQEQLGLDGEMAVGHYFLRSFAMDMSIGYFGMTGTNGNTTMNVIPVLMTAKAVLPYGRSEPYLEVGAGAYFSTLELNNNSSNTEVTGGFHAGAGVNFNLTPSAFFGFEARYIWNKSSYSGQDIKLDGATALLNVGYRFGCPLICP